VSFRWLAVALLAAACSSISENEDGIATLEIRVPRNTFLEQGVPLTLSAVARNSAGDSVAAEIVWRTPDTTVTIDSVGGTLTPIVPSGSARIQAAVRGRSVLASDFSQFTFSITRKADSLVLDSPDSIDVVRDTLPSPAIAARLIRLPGDPGVAGRPIVFRIIDPAVGPDTTVVLGRGRPADSVQSAATGGPGVPVTVQAARGRPPPDRVVVEITAHRASGAPIPGSGRLVVIRFLHQ
jgi:hypothetical protein